MGKNKNQGGDCASRSTASPLKETTNQPVSEESKEILYKYIYEISERTWNLEIERENSLLRQSGQMQAAFSFVIAALFMALPVMMDNREKLSDNFFFLATSVITFFLLLSLLMASLAAYRYKYKSLGSIEDNKKKILSDSNWQDNVLAYNRYSSLINCLSEMESDKHKLNDRRSMFIRISMLSFIVSIASIVTFYIIAVVKLWK